MVGLGLDWDWNVYKQNNPKNKEQIEIVWQNRWKTEQNKKETCQVISLTKMTDYIEFQVDN